MSARAIRRRLSRCPCIGARCNPVRVSVLVIKVLIVSSWVAMVFKILNR